MLEFDDPERRQFEMEYSLLPAPPHVIGELINDIHHVTPDGGHADGTDDLVSLCDGRYVYNEAPPYPFGMGRVGLTELQFISEPAQLEEMARYDAQFIAGERDAVVNGSVEDLLADAMRLSDSLSVIRHVERQYEYGGYGGTSRHETLGVAYYYPPQDGETRTTLFEVGVVDPKGERMRVTDAREWTRLIRLKRLDQQLDFPDACDPSERHD